MSTFVYSPGIRVHIESSTQGLIDVSGDITNWTLTRRSNTVSSFNFVLQNAQRKYDGVFRPADRITVQLKRITWVNVFTGSLNNSPIFSAWPRALPMSASCSLKKLQFWPWDPTTQAATNLISRFFADNNGKIEGTSAVGDGGLSKLVTEALAQVTNWDRKAIHIGAVPNAWFKWAQKTEQDITAATNMAAVLGSSATINGNQVIGSLNLPANTYGGVLLDSDQTANFASVYACLLSDPSLHTAALQDRAALITFMVIMQESGASQLDHGPDGSVGMYQQIPSWGSVTERMDVAYSTTSFIHGRNGHPGLLSVSGWNSIDPTLAAQTVQVSAYPTAYAKWQDMANSLVTTLRSLYGKQIQPSTSPGINNGGLADGIPNGQSGSKTTGTNLAAVAHDLIASRPAGSIRYQEGGDDPPQSTSPTVLDCSSLVEWCYYHATGSLLNHRTSEQQYAYCSTFHLIPLELAKDVQGALLFNYNNGDASHVGISLGGDSHVAAHTDGIPLPEQVNISPISTNGGFNTAGLLPGIDYTKAAVTQAAADQLQAILKLPTGVSPLQLGTGNDPSSTTAGTGNTATSVFQQLITAITNPPTVSGDVFTGSRALMHNTPFLPWIKNMTNASMRAFCSAPNGDFIAWFPDYFNVWGTAAVMNIQPIELQDFTVDWSDQQIVTHEYVLGSIVALLDGTSGGILSGDDGSYSGIYQMQNTNGIATMDFPQIFQTIYGKPASKKFIDDYLTRFGARPNVDQMANIQHGRQEFYMALWNFMYYWAAQFSAQVPMTFMPELYPGMILKIPAFDFQAYVTEVTHSGSYGQNGGFTTTATIVAPARTSSRDDLFGMLPLSGNGKGA